MRREGDVNHTDDSFRTVLTVKYVRVWLQSPPSGAPSGEGAPLAHPLARLGRKIPSRPPQSGSNILTTDSITLGQPRRAGNYGQNSD